jgi:hypothetical protein
MNLLNMFKPMVQKTEEVPKWGDAFTDLQFEMRKVNDNELEIHFWFTHWLDRDEQHYYCRAAWQRMDSGKMGVILMADLKNGHHAKYRYEWMFQSIARYLKQDPKNVEWYCYTECSDKGKAYCSFQKIGFIFYLCDQNWSACSFTDIHSVIDWEKDPVESKYLPYKKKFQPDKEILFQWIEEYFGEYPESREKPSVFPESIN